ncbi:MAG TPA: hypothetical protein VGX92_15105 [Pyrinomonadaceae bacterium]|jgi:hypothetical protein|nr:hypothetical protein [Pyrinomonadaceae bacterium]
MLFLASRILEHELRDEGRLHLLEKLQERNFIPLIRSTRLSCYGQALSGTEQVGEMERLIIANLNDPEKHTPYIQGDIFCFDDHIFFLLFGDLEDGSAGMRAGVVYEPQTTEPLQKLNSFCQTVRLCLAEASGLRLSGGDADDETQKLTAWRQSPSTIQQGFMRFVARQDADSLSTIACRENARERVRAAKFLDDDVTRLFLRRAREAYAEGYAVSPSAGGTTTTAAGAGAAATADASPSEFTINKLLEVGLLRREVLVSCRKSGHALFSLPSADALAVITISHARCSECGANIADEKIEELFAPTQLSSNLLEDGAWLVNRLHRILRELGISESEIAVEPPAGDGEARMMARVCGESFLIVMRDGDLSPAFARRAINTKIETEARHLVLVVTGTIHNEARTGLHGFASRMTRGGNDFELILAEGVGAAETELRRAFERVSQKVLAEQLCELDASMGLSVAQLITSRFQMLRDSRDAEQPDTARLPAPTVQSQNLQNMVQAVSLIDFNLLEINDEDESITTATTLPRSG